MHSHSLLRGVCSDSIPGIPDRPGPGLLLLPPLSRQHTAPACPAIHDTGSLRGIRLSAAPRIIPAIFTARFISSLIASLLVQALRLPEGQTLKVFRIKERKTCLRLQGIFSPPHAPLSSPQGRPCRSFGGTSAGGSPPNILIESGFSPQLTSF